MQRGLRHIANLISSLRIVLVIPIAWALLHRQLPTTLVLVVLAAASDAADGFLAKRFGWQSALGALLDPIADKLMLATIFVVLAILRLVPIWLVAAAVARDVIIALGAMAYRICIGPVESRPSFVSKLNTLCQSVFVLSVIGHEQFAVPPRWTVLMLGALTFSTVAISGIDYVLRYGRRAWDEAKSHRTVWRADGSKPT